MAYIKTNNAHSHHQILTSDGAHSSRYSRYEVGHITGRYRDLPAIIADETGFDGLGFDASAGTPDDSWYVINTFKHGGRYVDSIAVGGAMDADHALRVAETQLDSLGADYGSVVMQNIVQLDSINGDHADSFSIDAISKLMTNPSQDKHYLAVITASELHTEAERKTFDCVQWDSSDGLVSHGGKDSRLYVDMTRADTLNELVNELDLADELARLGAEEAEFDALMDSKTRLPLLKDRLFNAMSQASTDGLSVTNVTQTKPFKRQGVSNIAFVFDLSDGQKLSIWFHNPDSTPSKLMASDIMISWKWMLNKRDMTAVLSPKNGDNVQLPVLARRIMRVAAKNSKRFKAAQARKAKVEQDLLDAQKDNEQKQETIKQLDQDIDELNKKIDAAMKAPKPERDPDSKEEGVYQGRNSSKEPVFKLKSGTRYVGAKGGHRVYEHVGGDREDRFLTVDDKDNLKENRLAYMFSDDVTALSDEDLSNLYQSVSLESQNADEWNKNMNALQNEGGEGFDFGGDEAEKLSKRRFEIKKEIDRRKNNEKFTPKFMLEIMRTYWGKLLFVDERYDMRDVAESLGVDYFTTKRMISVTKDSESIKDAIAVEAAKQIEYYKDNAEGRPAYPEIIAAILASMGGYKPSDNHKLLDIANKIISGEVQAIDVAPESKKKHFKPASQEVDTDKPILELKGNELGGFEDTSEGKKQLRAAAKNEFNKLLGQWIECPALSAAEGNNTKIEIRKRGIKEFMAFSGDSRKLKLVAKIAEIIKTASLSTKGWQDNEKVDKKPMVAGYYNLENKISIDGEVVELRVLIEKDNKGLLHYDVILPKHEASFDNLEQKNVPETAIPDNYSGVASSTPNIKALNDDDVKQDQAMFDRADIAVEDWVLNMFILNDTSIENTASDEDLPDSQSNSANITTGKKNTSSTVKGTEIKSSFALVEAKSLITSHDASGAVNPSFPQELQPRDRSNKKSVESIKENAKNLQPEKLGDTKFAGNGAPIVGDDLIVESGNGRVIAINTAYQNGSAGNYKQWLIDNAQDFGFSSDQVQKYEQPVLVRVRETEVDRIDFTVEANLDPNSPAKNTKDDNMVDQNATPPQVEPDATAPSSDAPAISEPPVIDDTPSDAPVTTDNDLASRVDVIVSQVESSDFDPVTFDSDELIELLELAENDADLSDQLNKASKTYQDKLVAISMKAMASLAGSE